MEEKHSNMWEEMVERQKCFIRELLEVRGIPPEKILFYEWWCVFPYMGLWIRIFIENRLKAEIYQFPEGKNYQEILLTPFSEKNSKILLEFRKKDLHCNASREKAVEEIFNVADAMLTPKYNVISMPL